MALVITGGGTDPFETQSRFEWWSGNLQNTYLVKQLLPMWITAVVSLHLHVKQLLPMWIAAVVSLHSHVKQLLQLWVTAVVGGQEC